MKDMVIYCRQLMRVCLFTLIFLLLCGYHQTYAKAGKSVVLKKSELTSSEWSSILLWDKNSDEVIDKKEAKDIDYLKVNKGRYGYYKDKMKYLIGLEMLDCSGCSINELDLRPLKKLTYLNCAGNKLTSLDLSKSEQLSELDCSDNKIKRLDMTSLKKLTSLKCSENRITSLDLGNCDQLGCLNCSDNRIKDLDLTNKTHLLNLNCSGNKLRSLDLTNCKCLQKLICNNNKLSDLSTADNSHIVMIDCSDNRISKLDLRSNTALVTLICDGNNISELDLSQQDDVNEDDISDILGECFRKGVICDRDVSISGYSSGIIIKGDLSSFDDKYIKRKYNKKDIRVLNSILKKQNNKHMRLFAGDYSNELMYKWNDEGRLTGIYYDNTDQYEGQSLYGEISFAGLDKLNDLSLCDMKGITSVDISKNRELKNLMLSNCGPIKEIKWGKSNRKLEKIGISCTRLTRLDVSLFKNLKELGIVDNPIKELKLGSLSKLKTLYCYDNMIKTLDVTKAKSLESLCCGQNRLQTLDLSNNPKLEVLNIEGNRIKKLDLSKNMKLSVLEIGDNPITEVKLGSKNRLSESQKRALKNL